MAASSAAAVILPRRSRGAPKGRHVVAQATGLGRGRGSPPAPPQGVALGCPVAPLRGSLGGRASPFRDGVSPAAGHSRHGGRIGGVISLLASASSKRSLAG